MDLDFIKRVIELVESADITELEVESEEGIRVVVKKGGAMAMPMQMPMQMPMAPAPAPLGAGVGGAAAPSAIPVDDGLAIIKSPIVGTFYGASSPDAPSFVEVGSEVSADTVVCILEAMKVMNEIKAGVKGVIREILIENGEAVEYDQPLFKIEKR